MAEPTKLRLVRCPKCENLLSLSEPEDSPFFQCGGCFTVLRAKIKEREAADSVSSDKSIEDRAKPVSVNSSSSSPYKAIVDSSETSSDSDVLLPSNQQNVPVDVESDPCPETKPNSSILVEKDDPKSQSGRQDFGFGLV